MTECSLRGTTLFRNTMILTILVFLYALTVADAEGATPPLDACAGMFKSDKADIRILALDQAMKHKDNSKARVVDLMIQALQDNSAGVRSQGARCLGRLKDKKAVGPLVESLGTDDRNVASYYGNFKFYQGWRTNVIAALAELGTDARSATPVIRQYLSTKHPGEIIAASARFLGVVKDTESRSKLIALFKEKKGVNQEAKGEIIEALGKIGGDEAFRVISQCALNENDYGPQTTAITALADFDKKKSHGVLLKILRSKGSGSDWSWAVGRASYVAMETKMPGVLKEFLRLAKENQGNRDLCRCVANALNDYSGPPKEAVPVLDALAKHSNYNVPFAAIKSARKLGQPGIQFIIRCVEHSHANVRCMAAETLGELRAKEALPALKKALKDSNKYVQRDAKKAISDIQKNK